MTNYDDVFRALSDEGRREVLFTLRNHARIRPLSEDSEERESRIKLRHVHLPLLEANDLVVWNRDTGVVSRGEEFEAADSVLAAVAGSGDALPDETAPEAR